jgi:DNA polymerase-3 subunit delta
MAARADLVVFVDGDDATLVAEAVAVVVAELVGDGDRSLAVEDYGGDEVNLAVVADGCATPPFLVERRVVVVREVGRFSPDEVSPLLSYLEHPLDSTALVLAAGGGQTPAKLLAAVKAAGRVVATRVDSRQAGDWIRDRVKKAPISLEGPAESLVRDHFGEDVSRLVPLLELLTAVYGAGARLTVADVEPYLGEAGSVTPWAFTDAIDSGAADQALEMMHRLLEGGDRHPLVLLAIVTRHVQSLMRVDGAAIRTEVEAAEAMGIAKGRSTYPAKKALAAAGRWGSANIADAVALVAEAEVDLKGASAWPAEAVLEVLVARLCRLARPPRAPARARGN